MAPDSVRIAQRRQAQSRCLASLLSQPARLEVNGKTHAICAARAPRPRQRAIDR